MGEVILGVDFKGKRKRKLRKMAEVIMTEVAPETVIYESSLGFVSPEKEPA